MLLLIKFKYNDGDLICFPNKNEKDSELYYYGYRDSSRRKENIKMLIRSVKLWRDELFVNWYNNIKFPQLPKKSKPQEQRQNLSECDKNNTI